MRLWIKTRYFTRVPTISRCTSCQRNFFYTKTSRPRLRCEPCARSTQLDRMRVLNREYRRRHKIRLAGTQ